MTIEMVRPALMDAFRIAWFLRILHGLGDAHRGIAPDAPRSGQVPSRHSLPGPTVFLPA